MRLYTRSGDDGTTGLFGGGRVAKDDPRVEAGGAVDELSAALGLAAVACDPGAPFGSDARSILREVQGRLLDLGADLATPPGSAHEGRVARIAAAHVAGVEAWIDRVDAENDPLRTFLLPGGTELAARLHLARAVCRRAERRIVSLGRCGSLNRQAGIYLNRLSDLLFAMARRANKAAGVGDDKRPA
jgi:cob(I)alamin adenosyltransferase